MKFKVILLLVFMMLTVSLTHGQIRFSENIQTSTIANRDANALYFVDFWATWCGPCVYATEYLEVLQKQYPNQFYVVSLSEENPDKVKRHLKKHHTELAVAIDFNGETFDNNKVKVLPYGILLNANGNILWSGNPTDFKASDLKKFLKQNSKKAAFEEVFKIESDEENETNTDYIPKDSFEINELEKGENQSLEISEKNRVIEIKGCLSDILANHLQVSKNQIFIDSELNRQYRIFMFDNEEFLPVLKSMLDIEISTSETKGDLLLIDNSNTKFWDANQIDWGKDTARYLIDDNQIQADNVSFKDVVYQLSNILDLPIVTTNPIDETTEHDWIIHHKFFSLMQSDLLDNYGLKAEMQQGNFITYSVTKKTP